MEITIGPQLKYLEPLQRVAVGLFGQRGNVGLAGEGVGGGLGYASATTAEICFEDDAVAGSVGEDEALGLFDGLAALARFSGQSTVHLAALIAEDVPWAVDADVMRFVEGVGSGCDGLGFDGFEGPAWVHLARDDAGEIIFDIDIVDDVKPAAVGRNEADVAAVFDAVDMNGTFAGL